MMKVVILSTETGEESALLNELPLFPGKKVKSDIVELKELISSFVEIVAEGIHGESNLKIEIGGTIKIKGAENGQKVVCFNLSSDANRDEQHDSIRLILETPVSPKATTLMS